MRQEQGRGSSAPAMDVSVHGIALSESERAALRDEVSRIVQAEQQLLSEEAVLGRQGLAADGPGELSIRFEMSLPPLAERRAKERIESVTRSLLGKHLRGGQGATLLICDPKQRIPGAVQNIDDLGRIPWPPSAQASRPYPGTDNLQYAVAAFYLRNASGSIEDTARLILEDGSIYWGQSDPKRMELGLATRAIENSSLGVDWEKALRSDIVCGNPYQYREILSAHRNPNPVFMQLLDSESQTVIFRKTKWFVGWTDMYHLDPVKFWPLLGGKRATFVWLRD